MAIYAIGDVQGCYPELQRLLEHLHFDPVSDRLWFCGDLVNRGGESLEVLRLVHGLREQCIVTLGNHDLSLLAIAEREPEARARTNPDLRRVLEAEDSDVLMEWLRGQRLAHHDETLASRWCTPGLRRPGHSNRRCTSRAKSSAPCAAPAIVRCCNGCSA